MTDTATAPSVPNGTPSKGRKSGAKGTRTQAEPAAVETRWDLPGTRLQRVILPRAGDPLDVRALYVDEGKGGGRPTKALSRTAAALHGQVGVSFATYFNAFPASYWRQWTTLTEIELRLVVEGSCRIDVYRSKADGCQIHVADYVTDGTEGAHKVRLPLDLAPFVDGGWYWFDVTTDSGVTLHEAAWYAPVDGPGRTSIAVGICTFNRPEDCANALAALGEDDAVREGIGAVFVADQGNRKVRDVESYATAAEQLGDRLRVVDQPNLGGSGGFSRVMYEALQHTDCEQILLLDDDIVLEPDSLLRAAAFSRFAERPTIVGGQMLALTARSVLHTMGEVVDRHVWMWRAAAHVEYGHNFAKYPLRHETKSADLHRRIDVDYNGWWMCMIPRVVAEELGLPLPLFIKWDDTEYGLRAAAHGYPTATLPGAAIWHMPWTDKDDAVDWQAYFHMRNRLVVAALHGHDGRIRGLVKHSLKDTLKHLMSLQYSTVMLRNKAIRDFEQGPLALFDSLPTALGEINALRKEFPDARVFASPRELPMPTMGMTRAERFLKPPATPWTIGRSLLAGLVHNTMPAKPEHHERPQLNLSYQDARWFMMARLDGATVATADARGVAYRKRDPRVFFDLLKTSVREHIHLSREFPKLRKAYRDAQPELTGFARWEEAWGIRDRK
ncbi:MAG TPA: glycosyltransferase [Pseudonocardia sp.]|jgi:galactofuranosylgalactofuranosylrhamnosyl-N-acetylglucosaminyl-diphospho-decaprenol beta-1,5/1,6-galactofuranosyltransferase